MPLTRANYVAPGEDAPELPIQYAERIFTRWPLPEKGEWKKSVGGAIIFGLEEAAKKYELPKKQLVAEVSDPDFRSTRLSAREWAQRNVITVYLKTEEQGLATSRKQLNGKVITEIKLKRTEVEKLVKETTDQAALLDENKSAQAQRVLTKKVNDLEGTVKDLEDGNKVLKGKVNDLQVDVKNLEDEKEERKEGVENLRGEVNALKEENAALRKDVDDLKKLQGLRFVERVLLRKLCESARRKCLRMARDDNLEIPMIGTGNDARVNWRALMEMQRVLTLVREEGLVDGALFLARIPGKLNIAAHASLEDVGVYLETVAALYPGDFRDRLVNIFEFVYPDSKDAIQEALQAADFDDDD